MMFFSVVDKQPKSRNREKNNNVGVSTPVMEPTIQHGFTFRPTSSLSINSNCSEFLKVKNSQVY
jgi:hypothetical protein